MEKKTEVNVFNMTTTSFDVGIVIENYSNFDPQSLYNDMWSMFDEIVKGYVKKCKNPDCHQRLSVKDKRDYCCRSCSSSNRKTI